MNHPAAARAPGWIAAAGVAACLLFAGATGHIWEDYFITFRSSLNLATGHGLVYEHGQRVHSFTSPLGTLLPAGFALGGGDTVIPRALWAYRVVCALALGGALWLVARQFRREGFATLALAAGGLAWALDPKVVDFTINGMETGLLILFIAITWWALVNGARSWPTALGLAGLQWTRPDGGVFFAVLALAWILFGSDPTPGPSSRWERLRRVVRGAALGILAYLPWVGFAWWYFGSPIPHTILAKISHREPAELLGAWALYPWRLVFGHTMLHSVYLPSYFAYGGWPVALLWPARFLAVGAAFAWLWPRVKPAGRVASSAFFLGGFYVEYIPGSPWYYPGWQSLGWIAWAYLLQAAWTAAAGRPWAGSLLRISAALIVALQVGLLGATAVQMRAQQAIIEDGHRREVGRWLGEQARGRRASIYLEPLGYIGFFSGLKMYDYPGLCSPEVVAARREGRPIVLSLRPDWLVFRPREAMAVDAAWPGLLTETYRLVRVFDARSAIESRRFLPGRGYLEHDAVFMVYGKAPPKAAAP